MNELGNCIDGHCHHARLREMMCLQAAMKTEAGALPSEAVLVRQPSVVAAVHQTLLDMPAPPLAGPLSDSSSGSRDLAMSEGGSQMLKTLCSSLSHFALSSSGSQDWHCPKVSHRWPAVVSHKLPSPLQQPLFICTECVCRHHWTGLCG